ncbi:acylphosphatase [Aestuariivirga sp.]|uniref:acylphosphatase n=1 Tax=Aestuariivirga sp. TaxID=2650926 RepID=UPI003919F415
MSPRAVHVMVEGRVQGVGFRAFVEREARARGLRGWVRNRSDGSVEAVFAGEAEDLQRMIAACQRGPRMAVVSAVRTSDHPDAEFSSFAVRQTL